MATYGPWRPPSISHAHTTSKFLINHVFYRGDILCVVFLDWVKEAMILFKACKCFRHHKVHFSNIRSREYLSTRHLITIQYDQVGGKGRGYFACKPILEGGVILYEESIAAESLEQLARKVWACKLSHWLHTPEAYPIHKPPSDLKSLVDERSWSKIFAQTSSNGWYTMLLNLS